MIITAAALRLPDHFAYMCRCDKPRRKRPATFTHASEQHALHGAFTGRSIAARFVAAWHLFISRRRFRKPPRLAED